MPLRVAGALALALLLHRGTRAAGLQRGAVFLPTVVPDVAIALVWLFLVNPLYGPIPVLLGAAGLPVPDLLTTPTGALALVVAMSAFAMARGSSSRSRSGASCPRSSTSSRASRARRRASPSAA